MPGFWDSILFVDLTNNETWFESLGDAWEKFIGGIGIGSFLFSKYGGKYDPFDERNPIIIATGPLVGTAFPDSGRHEIVSRSPQTNLLGESNSGGHFGYELKRSGIDGIVISGKAELPEMIYIRNGEARIEDASNLWSLDIYETQEKIKRNGKFSVMAIGPAGENLVLFSSVMNDEGRASGRTGMGAVFGSKKLKAIAVQGNKIVDVYNRNEFARIAGNAARQIHETPVVSGLRSYGSMIWMDGGQGFGDIPANYFTNHDFNYDSLSSITFNDNYKVKSYNCSSCVIGCGRSVSYENRNIDGPEYETVAAFGPLLGNQDMNKILLWNDMVNALGMDSISTGVLFSALKYYLDNGMLDDPALREYFKNDFSGISKLIYDIAHLNGSGKYLASGLERFALSRNIDRDQIATVKELEVPLHDPRAFKLQGLVYATSSRGADHMQGDMYQVDVGGTHEEIGITMGDRYSVDSDERVMSVIKTQDYRQVYNSLIICYYAQPSPQDIVKAYVYATGFDQDLNGLMDIGSRIIDMKRRINVSLGLKPEDDWLPKIVRSPIPGEPPESGTGDDELKSLLKRYYRLRKW